MNTDMMNAVFEFSGGVLLLLNVIGLYRDKAIKGVRIIPTSFFMFWGYWNLYFYPSLGCWWSFAAGVVLVVINTVWVGQMVYYRHRSEDEH